MFAKTNIADLCARFSNFVISSLNEWQNHHQKYNIAERGFEFSKCSTNSRNSIVESLGKTITKVEIFNRVYFWLVHCENRQNNKYIRHGLYIYDDISFILTHTISVILDH